MGTPNNERRSKTNQSVRDNRTHGESITNHEKINRTTPKHSTQRRINQGPSRTTRQAIGRVIQMKISKGYGHGNAITIRTRNGKKS